MSGLTLVAAATVHLATAGSFALVGRAVLRKRQEGAHSALKALATWWWGLGVYLLIEALLFLAAAASALGLGAFLATRLVAVPLICLAAGSLTYYMLYLFTGRPRLGWLVSALYGATTVLFLYDTFVPAPTGLRIGAWQVDTVGAGNPALVRLIYYLVGLPPILSSLALIAVAGRLEPEQRYQARLVGLSILAYVGSGLAAFLGTNEIVQFVALTLMGLLASILVLLAYYPPQRMRQRWRDASAKAA